MLATVRILFVIYFSVFLSDAKINEPIDLNVEGIDNVKLIQSIKKG